MRFKRHTDYLYRKRDVEYIHKKGGSKKGLCARSCPRSLAEFPFLNGLAYDKRARCHAINILLRKVPRRDESTPRGKGERKGGGQKNKGEREAL